MSTRYRMDPEQSRFTVQAFAGGLLSFMGHSPTFAVRNFTGELRWQPNTSEGSGLEVIVRATSLDLLDKVRPADREEIERRMRQEVLETATFPEIRFEASEIMTAPTTPNRFQFRATGQLSLHGVTNTLAIPAELEVHDDGIRLSGECPLLMSEYRIRPVTALGGTIQLRDQLQVTFNIGAWREP